MVVSQVVSNSGNTILASSATTNYAVTALFLCNTATVADTVSVHLVADGGTAGDGNCIVKDCVVDPTDTLIFEQEKIILESGYFLYAVSDNGTITATVSAMEI